MDKVQAYGTFKKVGGHIFRTEARLKWGNSNKKLGLIIMLNPGSSKLLEEQAWNTFVDSDQDSVQINGKLLLDPTMRSVVRILEHSFGNLEGELIIQNLFNLRDSDLSSALDKYKQFFVSRKTSELNSNFPSLINPRYRDVLHTDIDNNYINLFPWVWLAWTVKDVVLLNARRELILNAIPENKIVFKIPKRNASQKRRKELFTYHPNPQKQTDRDRYFKEIVTQMRKGS
ncbi:hypothetical protein [Bacillus pinisoli]|uniref:hypothetical protein n=1 Tax=Bacillus pinisoli TaxID=2901866 RepID=UPI001FF12AD9|nr:hypothetical protein [Bacillus pinisoli]